MFPAQAGMNRLRIVYLNFGINVPRASGDEP